MSCNRLGMYTETSIQDLPDEMLEHILLFLNRNDRRSALRVCRRWSTLIPLSSVKLVVDFRRDHGQKTDYHRTLLASSRQYKHLVFQLGPDTDNNEMLVEILQHFSHKVETLKLIPCYSVPIEQKLIRQMLSLCSNLRHLHIDGCIPVFGLHNLEVSPMHKLEELYMEHDVFSLIPNMLNIMPNITRLHMLLLQSEEALILLRHYSSQLNELEFRIHSKDRFLRVCEMQFPLLEKLNFYCDDFEINSGGSVDEVKMIDLFFRQIPLLKEVTLDCKLDERVIQNVCRSCVNIQFLCIKKKSILQNCFLAICELKHLKHLRIELAVVDVPPEMYSRQTSLHKLTLKFTRIIHPAKFNSFVQRAFPNLAVMELLDLVDFNDVNDIDNDWLFELHGQICGNIPSLQRLVVSELDKEIILGRFLDFCATHATKDLRFEFFDIVYISENVTPDRIPMQKLVLILSGISPIMLQKLITSVAELKGLELGRWSLEKVGSLRRQLPRLGPWSLEKVRSLRKQLPRCHIAIDPIIPIIISEANYKMLFQCH